METILWVLPYAPLFLLVISLVITVHELGHYWVGRWFGAAAESFAIGFGKPIWEVRDRRGTRWRINWIPLGGFVKFVGEAQLAQDVTSDQPPTVETEEQRAQLSKAHRPAAAVEGVETTLYEDQVLVGKPYTLLNPWQRIAVSLGGPFANFIFAILAFATIGYTHGVPEAKEVYVTGVVAGSAAERAGFQPGDVVLQAGPRVVQTRQDVVSATQLSAGEDVIYRVRRGAEELTLVAAPVESEIRDETLRMKQKVGRVGIEIAQRDSSMRGLNPVEALGHGVYRTTDTIGQTLNVLRRLVTGKEGIDKLSGPVGILHLTGGVTEATMKQEDVSFGEKMNQLFWMLFQLAALLSVGIGFFNLLPLPVLDGGAVMMHLAEGVTGKPLPEKVQSAGLTIGLVCLVGFALVVTLQDVFRLSGGS
jgi:regulator of sigma E protease